MKKVVVVGGAGFIGSNLTRSLIEKGKEVTVLDNLSTGKTENLDEIKENINFVEGDITNKKDVENTLKGKDAVFHLAAIPSVQRSVLNPVKTNFVNINGTLNLLTAARDLGVKRFVFSSSSSVYGDTEVLPKIETMKEQPLSPYALQKLAGEKYSIMYSKLFGLYTVSLRYFNVFGPRQDPNSEYSAVIPKFISCILQNKNPTIYGDGEQTRDFTYISNVVNANILAAESENSSGLAFNVACGKRYSLNELYKYLSDISSTDIKPVYSTRRKGDVKDSLGDISLISEKLGYKVNVDFLKGLKLTYEYMKSK